MKKSILAIGGAILLIIIVVVFMFIFNACPPAGPWPTPPWCGEKFVRQKYDVKATPAFLSQVKAVNMYDTWGRNYNMGMMETTQANLETAFDRVRDLGAQEVFVHDFDRAVYSGGDDFKSQNYEIVDEIFLNDMRDESISTSDLEKLVFGAHQRGLKLGIKRNIAFVNIGKYIKEGIAGNISGAVMSDYQEFNSSHSEEWIKDYFQKWTERLIEKGRQYQAAGVDIMSISPSFQEPTFAGHEQLVNRLQKELISKLREVFAGKIMIDYNVYGLVDGKNGQEDWTKYDYYQEADIIEVKVYNILEKYYLADGRYEEAVKGEIEKMVADLNLRAIERGVEISIFFAPSSYKGGIFSGPVEYLDFKNPAIMNLEIDYSTQALAFDYFFNALKNQSNIERVNVGNFAWDDALDPEVKPRISVSAGFRNKPAEKVINAWYNFSQEQ